MTYKQWMKKAESLLFKTESVRIGSLEHTQAKRELAAHMNLRNTVEDDDASVDPIEWEMSAPAPL
jgi:hypothetical protein